MPKATVTVTIDWNLSEGQLTRAAVASAMGEALKDHVETLDFARELTDLIRDKQRLEGFLEIEGSTVKKNPSSVEEKAKRRGRKDRGDKAKTKRRKKGRSAALKRLMRGT